MVTPTKTDKKARCWWERLDLTGQHFVDPRFRTPAYEEAVKALVALRKEDPSLMTAAYAEAASTYIRLAYANSRRVRRSPGRNVFERLLDPEPRQLHYLVLEPVERVLEVLGLAPGR